MNIIRLLLIGGLVYFAMQQKKEGNRNMILIVSGLLAVCILSKEGFIVNMTEPATCEGTATPIVSIARDWGRALGTAARCDGGDDFSPRQQERCRIDGGAWCGWDDGFCPEQDPAHPGYVMPGTVAPPCTQPAPCVLNVTGTDCAVTSGACVFTAASGDYSAQSDDSIAPPPPSPPPSPTCDLDATTDGTAACPAGCDLNEGAALAPGPDRDRQLATYFLPDSMHAMNVEYIGSDTEVTIVNLTQQFRCGAGNTNPTLKANPPSNLDSITSPIDLSLFLECPGDTPPPSGPSPTGTPPPSGPSPTGTPPPSGPPPPPPPSGSSQCTATTPDDDDCNFCWASLIGGDCDSDKTPCDTALGGWFKYACGQ